MQIFGLLRYCKLLMFSFSFDSKVDYSCEIATNKLNCYKFDKLTGTNLIKYGFEKFSFLTLSSRCKYFQIQHNEAFIKTLYRLPCYTILCDLRPLV